VAGVIAQRSPTKPENKAMALKTTPILGVHERTLSIEAMRCRYDTGRACVLGCSKKAQRSCQALLFHRLLQEFCEPPDLDQNQD
jgi:hypothetical protein